MKKPSTKSCATARGGSTNSGSRSQRKRGKATATVSEPLEGWEKPVEAPKGKWVTGLRGSEPAPVKKKKKVNSRTKGKVGELELAHELEKFGITARRGQQFAGGTDSPDVVTDLTNVHFEVKRTEVTAIYDWLAQAERDAKGKLPIVVHRKNRGKWVAIVDLEQMITLLTIREGTLL